MRLLIDARPFIDAPTGGVGRVAYHLTKAYAETFPNDHIVCATTGAESAFLPDTLRQLKNIEHVHIRMPNKAWSAACLMGVTSLDRAVADKTGPCDAAFFPNIGFFGTPQLRYALLLHDLSFLIEPAWFTLKQRLWHRAVRPRQTSKGAAKVFAVSQRTARDAERLMGISADRITVLPMGPTLSTDGSHGIGHAFTGRFVLALGAGDARKNAATAIEAVRVLRKGPDHRDLGIVLVGRSRYRYPETWVHHLEAPSDADMAALYESAAVFLYPSWYEGYGLPLHEAASFGLSRIASTTGALPETAPPGTLFADPAKPHHWAEAIKLALSAHTVFPAKARIHQMPDAEAWNKAALLLKAGLEK